MGTPAQEALIVDRLTIATGIADIVIAGHGTKPRAQAAHKLGAVPQICLDISAVPGDVAGIDDAIGALFGYPSGERGAVVGEMRLARAQMRVGDVDYPHGSPRR